MNLHVFLIKLNVIKLVFTINHIYYDWNKLQNRKKNVTVHKEWKINCFLN